MTTAASTITRGSATALTWTSLASLASSATLVAGAASLAVTTSANVVDVEYAVKILHGTTPVVNTAMELWLIARGEDGNWPYGFAGTDAAATIVGAFANPGWLLGSKLVTAATGAQYDFIGSFRRAGVLTIPALWQLWLTHGNTATLASSGSTGNYQEITNGATW
jgi:hypothetical protein